MHNIEFITLLTTTRKENAYKMSKKSLKYIVFDHDGTLVKADGAFSLYDGIRELIQELNELGIKCYVWTARNRYSTVEILQSLDIIVHFEDISCSTDCAPKPNPEGIYMMLMHEENFSFERVAVVGDSFSDMIGANQVGALAIGALWGQNSIQSKKILKEYGADYLCETVEDCKTLLKSLI